jgi:hypothetical protein
MFIILIYQNYIFIHSFCVPNKTTTAFVTMLTNFVSGPSLLNFPCRAPPFINLYYNFVH